MFLITPAVALLATIFFVVFTICMLDTNLGGLGAKASFAWHPIFMAGGIVIMGLGSTAYVADYGDTINKIVGSDRVSRRNLHGIAGIISAMLVLVGWLIAWVVHEYKGSSHIAAGDPAYVQAHVWIGLVAIAGTLFQVCVGLYKFIVRVRDDRVWAPWHGALGPVVWTALVVAAGLGIFKVWGSKAGFMGTAAALLCCLVIVWLTTLVLMFLAPKRGIRGGASGAGSERSKLDDDGASAGASMVSSINQRGGLLG